jgi:ribonuclease P protein component
VGGDGHAGAQRLRLRPAQRLKRTEEFEHVRRHGQRLTKGCLILNWLMTPQSAQARLGVVASRKMGGAVVRTRAKRLLRESFRQHQHELAGVADLVLIARNSAGQASFAQVERDFLAALHSAGLLARA